MGKKSRVDLLPESRDSSERLQEQDLPLTRFKSPLRQLRSPKKSQAKRPKAVVNTKPLESLAETLAPVLRPGADVILLDGSGRVQSILGGCCESLEISREEIIGTRWKSWIVAEDYARWQGFFAKPATGHSERYLRFRVRSKTRARELPACAYRASGEEAATWVVLEGQAADFGPVEANAPNAAAKQWAGIFAHELNQPLAAVLTTAQACRNLLTTGKILPQEMLQGMEGLIRRVHHAADVVRRLRILAGGERPQRVAADLCEVVRRALDVLQGPLEQCHAAAKLDFARDFPAVKIDSVQIVQVVVNLLRNAIEAMCNIPAPRRQLTVRAQFDSREAIVAVEDQGVGLSVDAIQRLFQPLASTKATGMGLGLALCRQIVEAHGGRIWAKGNSPHGCVFSFSVPLEPEEP